MTETQKSIGYIGIFRDFGNIEQMGFGNQSHTENFSIFRDGITEHWDGFGLGFFGLGLGLFRFGLGFGEFFPALM